MNRIAGHRPLLGGLLLGGALLLSACVIKVADHHDGDSHSDHEQVELRNRREIAQLPLGMPLGEVQARLGEPEFTEAVPARQGEYRVLRYRTHRTHGDGDTTRDETTALVFQDGKLYGIGEAAYAKAMAQ